MFRGKAAVRNDASIETSVCRSLDGGSTCLILPSDSVLGINRESQQHVRTKMGSDLALATLL